MMLLGFAGLGPSQDFGRRVNGWPLKVCIWPFVVEKV